MSSDTEPSEDPNSENAVPLGAAEGREADRSGRPNPGSSTETGRLIPDTAWSDGVYLKDLSSLSFDISVKAQQRFHDRRTYEWKLAFVIWATLGAGIFFLMKEDTPATVKLWELNDKIMDYRIWWLIGFPIVMGGAHYIPIHFWLKRTMKDDQFKSIAMEKQAIDILTAPVGTPNLRFRTAEEAVAFYNPTPETLKGKFEKAVPRYLQVAITILLSALLAYVYFYLDPHPSP